MKKLFSKILSFLDAIEGLIRRYRAILLVFFAISLIDTLDGIESQIDYIDMPEINTFEIEQKLDKIANEINGVSNVINWK